jgi:hypothetical protein
MGGLNGYDFGKLYFGSNEEILYTPWCKKTCDRMKKGEYISIIDEIKIME